MYQFEEVSRPVLFEDPDAQFRYWGKGSSFLVSSARSVYWVTAEHVIANMGGWGSAIRVFPSDASTTSLPFNEKYVVKKDLDYDDYKDIFVLRVDLGDFDQFGDAPLVSQRLDDGALPASSLSRGEELWVIGYPSDASLIDYDAQRIMNTRSVIRALYDGPFTSRHCYSMNVETSLRLDSYDGLSGSPVYVFREKTIDGTTLRFPMLVGMVLRGTASSGKLHFMCVSVLESLVATVEQNA